MLQIDCPNKYIKLKDSKLLKPPQLDQDLSPKQKQKERMQLAQEIVFALEKQLSLND